MPKFVKKIHTNNWDQIILLAPQLGEGFSFDPINEWIVWEPVLNVSGELVLLKMGEAAELIMDTSHLCAGLSFKVIDLCVFEITSGEMKPVIFQIKCAVCSCQEAGDTVSSVTIGHDVNSTKEQQLATIKATKLSLDFSATLPMRREILAMRECPIYAETRRSWAKGESSPAKLSVYYENVPRAITNSIEKKGGRRNCDKSYKYGVLFDEQKAFGVVVQDYRVLGMEARHGANNPKGVAEPKHLDLMGATEQRRAFIGKVLDLWQEEIVAEAMAQGKSL